MAKKEIKTDLWVYDLLKDANIQLTAQGSDILEVNQALSSASKSQTGNSGYPEYCGAVGEFLLVIEDKAALDKHIFRDANQLISQEIRPVKDYAVNGALFYAKHIATHTNFHKIFAFGVSGDQKHHRITPIFVNERGDYEVLDDVETFISFNADNIHDFYLHEILKENTDVEKETSEILKQAAELHEALRTYGAIKDTDKPLLVSGIMLALREIEHKMYCPTANAILLQS